MAAQSIASRSRRRAQTEPDDVVLARALQFAEWARRNIIAIGVGAVVVLVLVAGLFWYRTSRAREMEEAAVAFLQVEQAVLTGQETVAQRELQLYIQEHGDTPYGDEARVLLAQVHLRGGRPAEAIEVLRPVANRIASSPVGAQAGILLATAHEAAGDREAAIQAYLRVANEAEMDFRRREALSGAALLREESGDYAGAAELYRRLVDGSEPGSAERSMYEMRLAEAEARATTSSTTSQ